LIDLSLTPRQARARDIAREAADGLLRPAAVAHDRDETFPTEALRELGRRGLMGVNIDPAHGGMGAGVVAYALAVRELAGACAGTTVAMMVTNMVAETIQRWADAPLAARFLPRITSGEWPAAGFSLSEPGAGSDAASLRTTATRDGDSYVLEGTKAWVTSGGHAGVNLVMAKTEHGARARGISAFLVPGETPGLTATKPEDKAGLRASSTTQLVFDGCRIPAANRVGAEGDGFEIAMTALDGGRVGVSAQACGLASAALKAAARYAAAQGLDDQGTQILLADSATELDAGWLLCMRAASMKDRGERLTREAAMSKVFCSEAADRICQRAIEVLGPAGFTGAHPVERFARDVRVTRIYEGTSEVQRIVIAREVLKALAA